MDDLWVERDQILEVLKHTEMALRKRILLDERAEFAGTLDDKGKRRLLKCKKKSDQVQGFSGLGLGIILIDDDGSGDHSLVSGGLVETIPETVIASAVIPCTLLCR